MSSCVGNICHKYISNDSLRLLYTEQNNLFDIIFAKCNMDIMSLKNHNKDSPYGIKYINHTNYSMYQYNLEVGGPEILTNNKNNNGLNKIAFIHSPRMSFLKKEDLFLMNEHNKNITKIFFSSMNKEEWNLENSIYIKYGIPSDIFYVNPDIERKNKVLLFNLDNNNNVSLIESVLNQNKIDYDTMTYIPMNVGNILNKYKVCLEINPANIINAICGIACGCISLIPLFNTHMDYMDADNLMPFDSINALVDNIKNIISSNSEVKQSQVLAKYNFDTFHQKLSEVFADTNQKVFTL
jgi:hypothetical protein